MASIMLSTKYFNSDDIRPNIYEETYLTRTVVNDATGLVLAFGMQVTYWAFAIIGNIVGLNKPEDWPAIYQSPAEAYTVRRFWGVT